MTFIRYNQIDLFFKPIVDDDDEIKGEILQLVKRVKLD